MQRYSSMNVNVYENLAMEFSNVKWVPKQILGLPEEGWFLLEITPCPSADEIKLVVSDIINNNYINVNKGRLHHSDKCVSKRHKVTPILQEAIDNIKEETYLVAVYPGYCKILNNQPVGIVLNPMINYEGFPDHPHLNMGGIIRKNNQANLYFPDSMCYGYSDQEYGNDERERLLKAFRQISIWLFRHQIWAETGKIKSPGIWIGPQSSGLGPEFYTNKINPLGECRCGSHKNYANCHMPYDYSISDKCSIKSAEKFINNNILYIENLWKNSISIPQQYSIRLLKSALL